MADHEKKDRPEAAQDTPAPDYERENENLRRELAKLQDHFEHQKEASERKYTALILDASKRREFFLGTLTGIVIGSCLITLMVVTIQEH